MKKNMIKILCINLLLSAGCMAIAGEKNSRMEEKKLSVKHEVRYTNKGTRSEGQSGYLIVNGISIPDCFNTVVADSKVYNFYSKKTLWGRDGYFPADDIKTEDVYPVINEVIPDKDFKQGWSRVKGQCQNMPKDWIFVKWEHGSAAVMPEKIEELIRRESLPVKNRRLF